MKDGKQMKKGDRLIMDGNTLVRITSARGSMVEAKYDRGPKYGQMVEGKIIRSRLTPTLRRATDTEIVKDAELLTDTTTGQMITVRVMGIFSGSTVMCRDLIRHQTWNIRPQDLWVDLASKLEE